MFELKKYRRAVFDSTKDWCKILACAFEFGKFSLIAISL